MIICLFKAQAEIFLQQESFEVDMSFKRVRGRVYNEVIFAVYLEKHSKSKNPLLNLQKLNINLLLI